MANDGARRMVVAEVDGSERGLQALRSGAAEAFRRRVPSRLVAAHSWLAERLVGRRERYPDAPVRRATMAGGEVDRDRYDSLIQRLFAVGLGLQSTLARITDPAVRERVRQSVTALDEIIGEARSALREQRKT